MTRGFVDRRNISSVVSCGFFYFKKVPHVLFITASEGDGGIRMGFSFFSVSFRRLPFAGKRPRTAATVGGPIYFRGVGRLTSALSEGFTRVEISFCRVGNGICFKRVAFCRGNNVMPVLPRR